MPRLTLTNLGPAFEEFLAQWSSSQGQESLEKWVSLVEAQAPEAYAALVWNEGSDPRWQATRGKALDGLNRIIEREHEIKVAFRNFERNLADQVTRFETNFSDFELDTPVIALPTLGRFNARVGALNGRDVLLFGLDTIVTQNDPAPILFSHELFHVHHARSLGNSSEWGKLAHLAFPLWLEGLATTASLIINPDYDPATALMDPDLYALSDSDLRFLARRFLAEAHVHPWTREGFPTYSKWFMFESKEIRSDLPNRVGYRLGYVVANRILAHHAMSEVIRWSIPQAEQAVQSILMNLASERRPSEDSAFENLS